MRYLIGFMIVVYVVALICKAPLARASIALIVGCLVVLGIAAVFEDRGQRPATLDQRQGVGGPAADRALQAAIPPGQIIILSQSLISGPVKEASHLMDYAAAVRNDSDRGLAKLTMRIRLYDCPHEAPADFVGCLTLGDNMQSLAVNISAHQSGDVAGRFQFEHMREVASVFAWRAEIADAEAAPAP